MDDERYMSIALRFARKGLGRTSPNPPVGAIIVKGGEVIGRGYHRRAGLPHAEGEAITDAKKRGYADLSGATMFVTLEPCCHHGRTPPCTELIAREGFSRVVVATKDPNPVVCGRGIAQLRSAGIDVVVGVKSREAKRLIEHFDVFVRTGRAYLAVKWAQSIDGKIAASDGSSRWISSPRARKFAHKLRDIHDAVIVGAGTIHRDNPKLTVRLVRGRNPVRIIVAGRRKLDAGCNVFNDGRARTIIVSGLKNPFKGGRPKGDVEVLRPPKPGRGKVELEWLLDEIASMGIISALMEGGSKLIASAFSLNLIDRIYAFISGKIIGNTGLNAVDVSVAGRIDEAICLQDVEIKRFSDDVMITGRMN